MKWGCLGGRTLFALLVIHEIKSSLVWESKLFWKFRDIHDLAFCDHYRGIDCKLVIELVRILVYSLLCIFVIMIFVIIISTTSISFVAILNHLYLNPRVLPVVRFSSPFHWGIRGGVSR